ncbi:uncharacterized protein KQ657_000408 [Scheffersomyces spartinae]|uniref:Aminopeptidase P N-terminal domain-containing protein n=1 Tax=Scheffersomyces spartinae TaxID=45513 RepID=A0A9P7VAA1_9ASCO|nr:uncharacterized protein KQ657_000408 [Scheffersomyces spartinae]KAG7193718.1 hypothetical protein KQ657_000408 [Scheffersomyces spartinae]
MNFTRILARALRLNLSHVKGKRHITLASRSKIPFTTGQPTHETRPHYLPVPGHITPGIPALDYYERRLKLAKELPLKSVAVLVGNQIQFALGSVFYEFQQDNDLYYMTGWLEPESVALIENTGEEVYLHMLVPNKDPHAELWEGHRTGTEGAYDFFNADYVENINKLDTYIADIIERNDNVFFDETKFKNGKHQKSILKNFFGTINGTEPSTHATIQQLLKKTNKNVRGLTNIIAKLRLVKSDNEINVMHAVGQISSRAINKAIAQVGSETPLMTEKSLAKYLEYQFVRGGCDKQAYIPVVASGPNSLTIHYTRNDDLLYRDELVFVDAGGKLGGYCSDISRTWPNSPQGFNEPQRDVYDIVLATNKACIDLCSEDQSVSLNDIHEKSVTELWKGLSSLPGFDNVSKSDVSRHLYPHYIGHHLGLDLHDVPSVSRFQKLVTGNVITIEPGLYIPENDKWPKWYHGIGVRVEDDVVVSKTKSGILNLTSGCVKEVEDIEALIRQGKCTTPGIENELVLLDI